MRAELLNKCTLEQLSRVHKAYTEIAAVYEDLCNGPRGAQQYKEYWGVMSNREEIRKRAFLLSRQRYE